LNLGSQREGYREHNFSSLMEIDVVTKDLKTPPDQIPARGFRKVEEVSDAAVMLI
jgi:hypothetical protein